MRKNKFCLRFLKILKLNFLKKKKMQFTEKLYSTFNSSFPSGLELTEPKWTLDKYTNSFLSKKKKKLNATRKNFIRYLQFIFSHGITPFLAHPSRRTGKVSLWIFRFQTSPRVNFLTRRENSQPEVGERRLSDVDLSALIMDSLVVEHFSSNVSEICTFYLRVSPIASENEELLEFTARELARKKRDVIKRNEWPCFRRGTWQILPAFEG